MIILYLLSLTSDHYPLTTLQRALRRSGLTRISTYTIRRVLVEAGWSWQADRSWCDTGTVKRRRAGQAVAVTVIDPDAEAKKN